jgi:hypothetical protein
MRSQEPRVSILSGRITNELNVCQEWPREPSHTSSTSIYSPQHIHRRYVQLAQLLRTHERSAPRGRTVRRTSNDYIDRLKPVKAIRKVKAGQSAYQGRTVRNLITWNNRLLVSQSNSSGLSTIHDRMVHTWTTYRPAKNPGRSVALLALMHMLPFMLYEALSFTLFKFIDP